MAPEDEPLISDEIPGPTLRKRTWLPRLIWVVPVVAALVGMSLVFRAWQSSGPRITIEFQSAEGIEIGKTLVKARNVTIGRVSQITLSDDQKTVLVTADLSHSGARVAKSDSAFWVVRPRIGIAGASGLETLLTGAFIGVKSGTSSADRKHFVGLETPPPLSHAENGKLIELHAAKVGSVAIGAPVYFRQFQVGRVIDLSLLPDGITRVALFIDAPNDRFLSPRTRFWNASGIELKVGADGVKIKTESLAAVIGGGIAFDNSPDIEEAKASFVLYKDEAQAMAPPSGEPHFLKFRFAHAVRGLAVDAPVEFLGVNIGSVESVDLGYDQTDRSFPLIVTAKIFPQRMGRAYETVEQQGATESDEKVSIFVSQMVARGLRAQARTSSLLSGSLYVALDFFPAQEKVTFDALARPLELPTIPASANEIEYRVTSIAKKLDELPLKDIAAHLDTDLKDIHAALEELKGNVLPQASAALGSLNGTLSTVDKTLAEDSPFRERLDGTLNEAQRTLSSLRELADYIDRHPEALLQGRKRLRFPPAIQTPEEHH